MSLTTAKYSTPEQLAYANVLDWSMKISFALVLITFLIYVFGIFPAHIPLDEITNYWVLPVDQYLEKANLQAGWQWVNLVGKGDFLCFISIAFLSAVSIVCYLRILPILFMNKDTIYGIIAILEVFVLVLAASGVLTGGSH